ncbi:tetratricopeptide repeat-containing sensor histidine kinase [Spirosoma gilvum]
MNSIISTLSNYILPRPLLILLLIHLLISPGKAQDQNKVGMLQKRLKSTLTDTARVHTLLELSDPRLCPDTLQAQYYLRQVVKLAQAIHYDLGLARAYLRLAYLASIRNELQKDSLYLQKAKKLLTPLYLRRKEVYVAKLLGRLAINESTILIRRKNLGASIQVLLGAIEFMNYTKDYLGLAVVYYNLGSQFSELDQNERALHYWKLAMSYYPQLKNSDYKTAIAASIASFYLDQNNLQLAAKYLQLTRESVLGNPRNYYLDFYYSIQGRYYIKCNKPDIGLLYIRKAIPLARQRGEVNLLAKNLNQIGNEYIKIKNYKQARLHLLESLSLLKLNSEPHVQIETLNLLANTEEKLGHYASALDYYRRRSQLVDRVRNASVQKQINALETKYQAKQRSQQIRLLQHNHRLVAESLRRQYWLSYSSFILVGCLLGFILLGYVLIRNRRRMEVQQQLLQSQRIYELEQERQITAANALLQGQEAERSRLARDLHDSIGSMLSSIKYSLYSIKQTTVLTPETDTSFSDSLKLLDSTIDELRRVSRDLMPESLREFGLVSAVSDICHSLSDKNHRHIQFQAIGLDKRLPAAIEVTVFRLFQELINNVLKHAQASLVIVQLIRNKNHVQLVVEDNGIGFDLAAPRTGLGLRSIQDRVNYLRGTLDLQTAPNKGTSLTIDFKVSTNA